MNPPKTAQMVKTKLIDLHTGTGSLGCLSVTSGILILKKAMREAKYKVIQ